MAGLVSTNRQGAGHFGKHLVGPGGKGLFDQFDAKADQVRRKVGIDLWRPAFVGVDDQPGAGGTLTHRLKPWHVFGGAKLDLQDRALGVRSGGRAHGLGRRQRQGESGEDSTGCGQPGDIPCPLSISLCFKIPQRAVDGVAGCAGGKGGLQDIAGDCRVKTGDLGADAVRGLAIAGVGHTLAPSRKRAARDFACKHPGLGL